MKLERPPTVSPTQVIALFTDLHSNLHKDFLAQAEKRYWYWDELKHRPELPYDDPEKAWHLIKVHRNSVFKLITIGNHRFRYCLTSEIQKNLHEFDLTLMGGLRENPIAEADRSQYLRNSLQEEAIASSQIEGAATTTQEAWEMLKSKRKPRNESEQMIFNNLRAIQFIMEQKDEPLSPQLVIELHRIMTASTTAEEGAGDFRKRSVNVIDHVDGEVAHTPPEHEELAKLMDSLCIFTNGEDEFIHPIVKASIIHFLIGYIHPFTDGNGRTARALFYWYMMKKGYNLIRHISISRAILESRIQYDKAYLKTEYDENDLTYFINYSIKSLRVAFESLVRFRDRKKREKQQADGIAERLVVTGLNSRQARLLADMQVKSDVRASIASYARQHRITRQTARKDLSDLTARNLLSEHKEGRNVYFRVVRDSLEPLEEARGDG